jgi:hypothetical protein
MHDERDKVTGIEKAFSSLKVGYMSMVLIRAHREDQIKSDKDKTGEDQIGLKVETRTTIIAQAGIIVLEEAIKEV